MTEPMTYPYERLWNGGNPLVNLKTLVDFTNSDLTATDVNFLVWRDESTT